MKSIKEICKELNITSRTIRHYEEYFHLSSERKSNVRYYDEEEFKKIKIIITLRKLDFPLHGISDILKELDNNTIINSIETEKEKYREQIKNSSRKILLLEDLKKTIKNNNDLTIDELIINDLFENYQNESIKQITLKEKTRIDTLEHFISLLKENKVLDFQKCCVDKVDMTIIKSSLIDRLEINKSFIKYEVYPEYALYNNSIIIRVFTENLVLDLKFYFNENNKVNGIWLIKFTNLNS